jgi:hypothetical protein
MSMWEDFWNYYAGAPPDLPPSALMGQAINPLINGQQPPPQPNDPIPLDTEVRAAPGPQESMMIKLGLVPPRGTDIAQAQAEQARTTAPSPSLGERLGLFGQAVLPYIAGWGEGLGAGMRRPPGKLPPLDELPPLETTPPPVGHNMPPEPIAPEPMPPASVKPAEAAVAGSQAATDVNASQPPAATPGLLEATPSDAAPAAGAPLRFSTPGLYGSNPLPIPAEADARLQRKLARDPDAGIGSPKNAQPIQLPNGVFIGPVSTQQWIDRNERYLSGDEIDKSANWYKDALPAYQKYFGDKAPAMMGAWLIANQNATPGFAQLSATRALEQYVNQTRGMPESLQAGLPADKLNQYWDAIISGDPSKFGDLTTGQKIYDFIDSAAGKNTRTFYGDDPRAGAPAVADVHTTRDTGFIDPTLHDWVRKTHGDKVADRITPDGGSSPSETQYEWSADRMRAITADLNRMKYRGRDDWTPDQAQAVGWKTMSTMLGRPGQTAEDAILSNARNLSYELDFGQGAPWHQTFPDWKTLTPQEQATVAGPVIAKAIDFAKRITGAQENWRLSGTGAWLDDLNPAYKSQFLSSPEVVQDVANILGHQLQQTEIFGSRFIPSGNKWALQVHGAGLDDPGNLKAIWADLRQNHPKMAAGFSPAIDENGVPGFHMFFNGGGDALGQRIQNELLPTLDASARRLGLDATADLGRGEHTSSVNDWSAKNDGWDHLQRLTTRYGTGIQARLEDHARTELESLIREGIDKALAARGTKAPSAPGSQNLKVGGAIPRPRGLLDEEP